MHVFAAFGATAFNFDDFGDGRDAAIAFSSEFHGVFAARIV